MRRRESRLVSEEESVGSESGKLLRSTRFHMLLSFGGHLTRSTASLICKQQNQKLVADKSRLDWGWSRMPKMTIAQDQLVKKTPSHMRTFRGRRGGRLESNRLRQRFAGHTRGSNLETNLSPWSLLERCFGEMQREDD